MKLLAAVVSLSIGLSAGFVVPVLAEAPTFKRVKPNGGGGRSLINIQVEPVAPVERVLTHVPDVPAATPEFIPPRTSLKSAVASDKSGWFWTRVSPSLGSANSNRMLSALQVVLGNSHQAAARAPGLERMQKLSATYGAEIERATSGTRVSPALVLAVMAVESAGKPAAKSSAGAVGLMQLMPATAKRFGVTDRTNPAQSIRGGVKYLDFLLGQYGGDGLLALAGYNAGEGAVQKNGGVPDYTETRAYVPKVIAAWGQIRQLCTAPPNRASDRCQFRDLRVAQQ